MAKQLQKFFAVYHITAPDKNKIDINFRELCILNTYDTEGEAIKFIEGRNPEYYFQFAILPVYEFVEID